MTSGGLLARNSIVNFAGLSAPLVAALFAIPMLISGMGAARFGVLALIWTIIGYMSFFDLGLGRALTQRLAEKLGRGEEREAPALVWTVLLLMTLIGFASTLILIVLAPWLVERALGVPAELQPETLSAFYLLALSLPVVTSTSGLRGVLEARQCFGMINAIRVPTNVYSLVAPLLVLPFSTSLTQIILVLILGRFVALGAHLFLCMRVLPELRRRPRLVRDELGILLQAGSWMTVSNLVSQLMTYMDRFLIGAFLSVTAVTYYVTPYEVVTKLWIVPGAVVAVLFPAFAESFGKDPNRATQLFGRGVKVFLPLLFPATLLLVTFASEGLTVWLGAEFARQSSAVLQWLALGVFLNCLGQVPFTAIQALGRPDLPAKLHLMEFPAYLGLVVVLIHTHGILGAAIAWTARVAVDLVVMLLIARRTVAGSTEAINQMARMTALALLLVGVGLFPLTMPLKLVFTGSAILLFSAVSWLFLFNQEEKQGFLRSLALAGIGPGFRASTDV